MLLAAPILLVIAMSVNWGPLYAVFIADVCLLVYAFGRRATARR